MLVAKEKKGGLKTVGKNYEELEEEIRRHKKKNFKRMRRIFTVIVLLVVSIEIIFALRSYNDYEMTSAIERNSNSAAKYELFHRYLLEYSNDGIACKSST